MKIIGAATGLGAQDPASGKGPDFLYNNCNIYKDLWSSIVRTSQKEINNNITFQEKVDFLTPFFQKLTDETKRVLINGQFPLVVGGDHSCAIGSWRALLETSEKEVGLMWLDAHLDAHTLQTTPSYAIHGMPLACLLGYGENDFLPKKILQPENVVIFGARSWEHGERELLDFLNVRIYEMPEILDRGLSVCFTEALTIVSRPELDFGISLDLDMFDPLLVPGVCSKEKDGIHPEDFIRSFAQSQVANMENLKMFEIVEFAPDRDMENKTFETLLTIMSNLKHR